MVSSMTRNINGTNCCPFDFPLLTIDDILLVSGSNLLALVDAILKMRPHFQEVRNTSSVIAMPMREKNMRYVDVQAFESLFEQLRPCSLSTTCIDEYTIASCTDDEGVCSLEGELACVLVR